MGRLSTHGRPGHPRPAPQHRAAAASGFTLLEVIIAAAVLVIGVLTMSGLVALAVQSNGHSRLDTTAVMLTQAVTEQVSAGIKYSSTVGGPGVAYLTDCGTHGSSNPWPVDSANGGSPLIDGTIDFSQAKVPGYHMDYVICSGNTQTTYDVRWNLSPLATGTTTSHTNILTVAARMENGGFGPLSFPIKMRVMLGPDPVPGL